MFAFPAMCVRNELLFKSWDSYTLNKFSWWTSKENVHYQVACNKISHQCNGVCSVVLRGLASSSVWCELLSGGWLTSSPLPGSRQTLETYAVNTGPWIGLIFAAGELVTRQVVLLKIQVFAFTRDSAYTFDLKTKPFYAFTVTNTI